MEAVVLPVLVVTRINPPFDNLGVCSFPLMIGDVIRHNSWGSEYSDYYLVTDVDGDRYLTENVYGHTHSYSEGSFDPIEEWYYCAKASRERKKRGFGKWFSEKVE